MGSVGAGSVLILFKTPGNSYDHFIISYCPSSSLHTNSNAKSFESSPGFPLLVARFGKGNV